MSTPPFGAQSMVAPLRRVLVKRPEDDFAVAEPVARRTPWLLDGVEAVRQTNREAEQFLASLDRPV